MKHAMILGAMKCGTSTLHRHLADHDNICCNFMESVPNSKEPDYFGVNPYGFSSYEEIWKIRDGHQYILDGSTNYSKYPDIDGVPQRIHEYGLTPKFVYMVRDPIERIISQMENYDLMPTEDMISVSKYHMQLGRFLEYFSRDDILVLTLEELQRDAQATVDRVLMHLELPSIAVDPLLVMNPREWRHLSRPTADYYGSRRYRLMISMLRSELEDDMTSLRDDFGVNVSSWGF